MPPDYCQERALRGLTVIDPNEAAGRFYRWAEELRTMASNVKDADCRTAMLQWAADYDRMAERVIQAGDPGASGKKPRAQIGAVDQHG